jgi:hypothetical protein|tara:strand:- start:2685 stop:2903 length:219 start_codon:yes stop_codon:yes gene_type:complete
MKPRTTQVTLTKDGGDIFDEGNYVISVDNIGGGEFISVRELCNEEHEIGINPDDWPELRNAIEDMIEACKGE